MRNLFATCVFLLTSFSSFAQDPQLFDNTWYLDDLIIDGNSNPPTIYFDPGDIRLFFFENPPDGLNFRTTVCLEVETEVSFDNPNSSFFFELPFAGGGIECDILPGMYEALYFDFFIDEIDFPFVYNVSSSNGILLLTITSESGDQAIYGDQILSIRDKETSLISIFPNPVKNELFITGKSELIDFTTYIFNIDGKLILEVENAELQTNSINVRKLTNGIYFLYIQDNQGQTEIKKFIKN